MSDFNSSLPVRTENNGDVVVKIGDGTLPSQFLSIDSTGRIVVKLDDGAGNAITSQANGGQRALDVGINVSGVQIDPRQIRALTIADLITAAQGAKGTIGQAWYVQGTDGTNSQAYLATGEALVSISQPLPAGTNTIGAVTQGTSPWVTKDQADGSVSGGTAGSFSMLSGGIFNTALPTLTTGQQASIQLDASGRLIIRPLTSADVVTSNQGTAGSAAQGWFTKITDGTNTAAVKASTSAAATTDPSLVVALSPNSPVPAGTNLIGSVSSRTQDGAGNAITSSTAGATRPLDVALRDGSGNLYSGTNPIPVSISSSLPGTEVNDYNTSVALAAGATSNHDYSVTSTKTFKGKKIWAAASGKMRVEVQVSPDGTTFTTKWVGFNSTAFPNITIDLGELTFSDTGAGAKIRVIRKNIDLLSQDVYSTISGNEI